MNINLPIKSTEAAMSQLLLGIQPTTTIHIVYDDTELAYMQLDHSFYAEFQGKTLRLYAHRMYTIIATRKEFMACTLLDILS